MKCLNAGEAIDMTDYIMEIIRSATKEGELVSIR